MSKKLLTLDIGAHNVALAEYDIGPNGPVLQNYGQSVLEAPLTAENAETLVTPALNEIMKATGMKAGPVAISVSGQMVFPKFAAIASAGGADKFEQAVRFEVEQNIPFPIDEMVCDWQVLGETESGDKSVMIVAAKTDQMEAIVAAVAAAGLRPDRIDVAPFALANAVLAADPSDDSCRVILDIGAKTTSLVIIEGDRVYNRAIPIAGNNINRDIAQALGCSPEEAEQAKLEKGYVSLGGVTEDEDPVADSVSKVCRAVLSRLQAEISRSINFYRSQQGGGSPTKLILCGGTALLPQIDEFFADALQVEVELFNPFEAFAPAPKVDAGALASDAAMLGPTVGLAAKAAGKARFAIDLIPPSIVAARREKARVPFVIAAGLTLVLSLGVVFLAVKHEGAGLQNRLAAVQKQADVLQKWERKIKVEEQAMTGAISEADGLKKLIASRKTQLARLAAARNAITRNKQTDGLWIEKWDDAGIAAARDGGKKLTVRGWMDLTPALVEHAAKANGGTKETTGEIVARKLRGQRYVDDKAVKIADMTTIGSGVEQFTVEVKFK